MTYKKTIIILFALLLVFAVNTSAETKVKKIRRVNVAPLIKAPKGGIADVNQLKSLVDKNVDRVKAGFEAADASALFPAFIEQLNSGDVSEKVLPKGQQLEWMLFYSRKKAKVIKNVEWAGRKTLDVFALTVQSECKDYHVVIPKACGNVSLVDSIYSMANCDLKASPKKANIGDEITLDVSGSICAAKVEVTVYHEGNQVDFKTLTPGNFVWKTSFKKPGNYKINAVALNADGVRSKNECNAEVYINYPPKCDLKVTPAEGYTGQPFKFDATGSTDKDGKVVKAEFTVTKDGAEVDKQTVTPPPLVMEKKFKKWGVYDIALKVTDDFEAVSANQCRFQVKVQKRFYLLAEGGPGVAKGTYSGLAFGRFGFSYLLKPERFSLVVSAGAAFTLSGKPFKNHFLSNVLLNVHAKDFFFGAGIGYSSKVREPDWDSGLDIVGNIGFDLFKSFNKKGSIFGELRVPARSGLSFEHAHEMLVGFRYQF
jgi:hypothetical protein